MSSCIPFQGVYGENQSVSAGASSASVSIRSVSQSTRLVNSGSNICYVRIGAGSQVATTSDTPVLSGESLIVRKADGDDTVAYISALGTTLDIQPGEGGV